MELCAGSGFECNCQHYSRPSDNSLTDLSLAQYNIGTKHIEDYSANLSLSWEADIWGKIRNQNKSALGRLPANSRGEKC